MSETKKFLGLKRLRRPGAKKLNGEALSAASRLYEKERNQIARAAYEKMKELIARQGVVEFNNQLHQAYRFR